MLEALRTDFAGQEILRQRLINGVPKYGNDDDRVDGFAHLWANRYSELVGAYPTVRGAFIADQDPTLCPPQDAMGATVGATPTRRHAGAPLADGGLSPDSGQDVKGPTSVLNSVSKANLPLRVDGALLNMKFLPAFFEGERSLANFVSLLRGFSSLHVPHVQFNVVSAQTLREAQSNPAEYRSLVVRVAGYSAYFVELDRALQARLLAERSLSKEPAQTNERRSAAFSAHQLASGQITGRSPIRLFAGDCLFLLVPAFGRLRAKIGPATNANENVSFCSKGGLFPPCLPKNEGFASARFSPCAGRLPLPNFARCWARHRLPSVATWRALKYEGVFCARTGGATSRMSSTNFQPACQCCCAPGARRKRAIARRAVDLIADGDTVFLESSTTVFELACLLAQRNRVTVVTNSPSIVCELQQSAGITVLCTRGDLQKTLSTSQATGLAILCRRFASTRP